jgi:hypothetical protein
MTRAQAQQLLERYNIPFQTWGTGTSKPLEKFFQELKTGEAKLIEVDGQLIRVVSLVVINVYFKSDHQLFKLFESHQIYNNGRIIKRNLPDSIYEKLMPNEDPIDGAKRAIAEELSITQPLNLVLKDVRKNLQQGISFPGILTQDTQYLFDLLLPQTLYKDLYTEVQKDKTSFFHWQEVHDPI